jgi:hypothetical protein
MLEDNRLRVHICVYYVISFVVRGNVKIYYMIIVEYQPFVVAKQII